MDNVVDLLKKERDVLSKRLHAVETAIAALTGEIVTEAKKVRNMSAATRAKIAKAAKERWAKVKRNSK